MKNQQYLVFKGLYELIQTDTFKSHFINKKFSYKISIKIMHLLYAGRSYMQHGKFYTISHSKLPRGYAPYIKAFELGTKVPVKISGKEIRVDTPIIIVDRSKYKQRKKTFGYKINPKYLVRGASTVIDDLTKIAPVDIEDIYLPNNDISENAIKEHDVKKDIELNRIWISSKAQKNTLPELSEVIEKGNRLVDIGYTKKGKTLVTGSTYKSNLVHRYIFSNMRKTKSNLELLVLYMKKRHQTRVPVKLRRYRLMERELFKCTIDELHIMTIKYREACSDELHYALKYKIMKKCEYKELDILTRTSKKMFDIYGKRVGYDNKKISSMLNTYKYISLKFSNLDEHISLYKRFLVDDVDLPSRQKNGRLQSGITGLPSWQRFMCPIHAKIPNEVDVHAIHPSIILKHVIELDGDNLVNPILTIAQREKLTKLFDGDFYDKLVVAVQKDNQTSKKDLKRCTRYNMKKEVLSYFNDHVDNMYRYVIDGYFKRNFTRLWLWMRDVKNPDNTKMSAILLGEESTIMGIIINRCYDAINGFTHYPVYDGIGCSPDHAPEVNDIANKTLKEYGYATYTKIDRINDTEIVYEEVEDPSKHKDVISPREFMVKYL